VMEHLNRATGKPFIFSTHDPQVMERAHRLILLRDGRVVSDETRGARGLAEIAKEEVHR
jgi:putative ABC transport system ATP-binding protein